MKKSNQKKKKKHDVNYEFSRKISAWEHWRIREKKNATPKINTICGRQIYPRGARLSHCYASIHKSAVNYILHGGREEKGDP